uniref:C2 domain-containing protein n=1 Tax=Anopheles maculatus TaxID=74869 RepID=A0A182SKG2_9DIPT
TGGDEGLVFEFGIHLNVGSSFGKTRLFFLGSASVTLRELLDGRLSCHKRCPVRLASDDILLGTLTLRMHLGRRGLHFGSELIDAVMVDEGNVTLDSSSDSDTWDGPMTEPLGGTTTSTARQQYSNRPLSCGHRPMGCNQLRHRGLFPHASWACTRHTGCPSDNQSPSETKDTNTTKNQQSNPSGNEHRDRMGKNDPDAPTGRSQSDPKPMETETSAPEERVKLLHGILHLGQLRSLPVSDYFLVCNTFWTDEPTTLTSDLCPEGGDFNYLHTFPVLANSAFIERVRNQHMKVELWQKPSGEPEKLIGYTRLSLHQFYIAFRDAQLSEHLSHAKLPVISIDGWSGITSPLAAEPCGEIKAILAIGTESQIEHFKTIRNLQHVSSDVPRSLANRTSVPSSVVGSPTRRIYPRPEHKSIQSMNSGTKQPQTSEVANMLSAFIENLAQRLPISSERSTAPSYDHNNASTDQPMEATPHGTSPHSNANRPQLRKTADLLDNLQKALSQRPPASALDGFGGLGGLGMATLLGAATTPADQTPPAAGAGQPLDAAAQLASNDDGGSIESVTESQPTTVESSGSSKVTPSGGEHTSAVPIDECKVFRVAIEIEQAVNLPKLTISKKYAKRHKNRNVPDTLELEPSAYATFEGYNLKPGMPNTVKSHEGIVYTTHVLERNCSPGWQKRFEVQLPVDLMMNVSKSSVSV